MKITRTGPGAPANRGRRVGKTGAEEAFRAHFDGGEPSATAAPSETAPLATLGGLLAIQEALDGTYGSKQAVRHGTALLDELRELQIGLVQGWISEDSLRSISRMLDRPRPADDDPELSQILDQIELRAAVELAKLDRQLT